MASKIEYKQGCAFISGIMEKPIKIPSAMFPLNSTPLVVHSKNTESFPEGERTEKIKAIFNSISSEVGRCYSNAEALCAALQAEGIEAETLVGWIFIGEAMPVHHCLVAVDGRHILDFNIKSALLYTEEDFAKTKEELRPIFVKRLIDLQKRPHSEVATFGQVEETTVFFCSQCKPMEGLKIFQKLMRAYPKHPALIKHDEEGRTPSQKLYYKSKGN